MARRLLRTLTPAALALAATLTLVGCAPADGEAPPADVAPAPAAPAEPGEGDDSGDDGAGAGDGDGGGAGGGECGEAPSANVDGGYPAENLPAVQARTTELAGYFGAADSRYCIDSAGDITYFLFYDFAEDGFHTLDVCGSVFTYFEGDFEGAAVVYTDATVRCG